MGLGEIGHEQTCGGSIINQDTILTAAHCIKPAMQYWVVAGQHVKYDPRDPYYRKYDLSQIIVHPRYDYSSIQNYDIAILKTREDIEFNDGVQPICLPQADQDYGEDRTMFLASGWGSLGNGSEKIDH